MRVKVNFSATGPLKHMVSPDGLVLDLRDGARVKDALAVASTQLGDEATSRLFHDEGDLRPGVVVVVNDELIRRSGGDRELQDGDELTIMMPVAGG